MLLVCAWSALSSGKRLKWPMMYENLISGWENNDAYKNFSGGWWCVLNIKQTVLILFYIMLLLLNTAVCTVTDLFLCTLSNQAHTECLCMSNFIGKKRDVNNINVLHLKSYKQKIDI